MSADPRQNEDIDDVAVFWFTKRRSGDMTQSDVSEFDVWLNIDLANQTAFRRVEKTWALVEGVKDEPTFIEMRTQDETTLNARSRLRAIGLAASIAVVAGGGWALSQGEFANLPWLAPAPVQEFRTSIGQQSTVTLTDGSTVTLDTNTVLRAQISHRERRIELAHGQAFFRVARDKSRPFVVTAAGKSVRATGTAFDVRVEPGRFEVTLVEGRVQVREEASKLDSAPTADMRQGWRLAVGEDARWRIEPVDLAKEIAWHDGMLAFFDKPMAQAVAEMNRYSRRKLVFQGEPPATLVLGRFQAGDVVGFARAAEVNKLARVVAENETEIVLAAR